MRAKREREGGRKEKDRDVEGVRERDNDRETERKKDRESKRETNIQRGKNRAQSPWII